MPLQLNKQQLNGSCKIFVPDSSIDSYKTFNSFFVESYANFTYPLSQLDAELKEYIKK